MYSADSPNKGQNMLMLEAPHVDSQDLPSSILHDMPSTPGVTHSNSFHFDTKEFGDYFFKTQAIIDVNIHDQDEQTPSLNDTEPQINQNEILNDFDFNNNFSIDYESTVDQVSKYINSLNIQGFTFPELSTTFKDEFIDGKLFLNLTKSDLNHLGCYEFAKRNRLYNHIQYLKSVIIAAKPNINPINSINPINATDISSADHDHDHDHDGQCDGQDMDDQQHLQSNNLADNLMKPTVCQQSKSLNLPPKQDNSQLLFRRASAPSSQISTASQPVPLQMPNANAITVGQSHTYQQMQHKVLFAPQPARTIVVPNPMIQLQQAPSPQLQQQQQPVQLNMPAQQQQLPLTAPVVVSSPQSKLFAKVINHQHDNTNNTNTVQTEMINFRHSYHHENNNINNKSNGRPTKPPMKRYSEIANPKSGNNIQITLTKPIKDESNHDDDDNDNDNATCSTTIESNVATKEFFQTTVQLETSKHVNHWTGEECITFPAVFQHFDSTNNEATLVIPRRNITELNEILYKMKMQSYTLNEDTLTHGFYSNLEIKGKRSNNGWLVYHDGKQLNLPHFALVYISIDINNLDIIEIEPIKVCGYVRNVERSKSSKNKFDSVWVESNLSMQATEYHHYLNKHDSKSQKLQDIVSLTLTNYHTQCFDNYKRGSNNEQLKQIQTNSDITLHKNYMPLKYKNDQYSTSCLVNDVKSHVVKFDKFDKVTFCMKLAQITNMKASTKQRDVFVQAWGVAPIDLH